MGGEIVLNTGECVLVTGLCSTLCDPTNCSLPRFSGHGILQVRMLEWIAIPFSRGSSWPKGWTLVSCITGRFFTIWATLVESSYPVFFPCCPKTNKPQQYCNSTLGTSLKKEWYCPYLWHLYFLSVSHKRTKYFLMVRKSFSIEKQ